MSVTVEERYLPLLVTFFEDRLTDADLDLVFARHTEVLRRRQPFAHLGDTTKLRAVPSAAQRKRIADWQQEIEPLSGRFNVGSAMVIPNTLIRGALTAINWVNSPVSPQFHASSLVEGYDWCVAQLAAAGIEETDAMRRFGESLRDGRQSGRP